MTCPVLLLRLLFNAKQAEQPVQQRPVSCLGHEQYQRAVQRLRLPLGRRCTFYLTGFTASHHPNAFDPVKAIFFLHCLLVLPGIRASVCNRKLISRPYRLHRLHAIVNVFGVRFKVKITAGYADAAPVTNKIRRWGLPCKGSPPERRTPPRRLSLCFCRPYRKSRRQACLPPPALPWISFRPS